MQDWFKFMFGEKAMKKKAENVHRTLQQVNEDAVRKALCDGASPHRLAERVVNRAQRQHPDTWYLAAISQLTQILKVDAHTAQALVAEFSVHPLMVGKIKRKYDWSLIPD